MSTKFTASDVKDASGLSYRQLNEWDRRGALPNTRDGDASWRRFSPRNMFVLLVLAELRKRFGVPLEQLKWVKHFMLQEGADHFAAAVEMMVCGLNVLLLTDFATTFDMSSDAEIGNLLYLGMTRDDNPAAFALLKVNPLVNRMLACRKEPIKLKIKDETYALIHGPHGLVLQGADEQELFRLIRSGEYQKVTLRLANGEILRVDGESEHHDVDGKRLAELLGEREFQTVTVTKQNGKVVRVTRTSPNVMDRTRQRREQPEQHGPSTTK